MNFLERAAGAAALGFAAFNLLQFVREEFWGADGFLWLAGVQKLASIFLMAWMTAISLRVALAGDSSEP